MSNCAIAIPQTKCTIIQQHFNEQAQVWEGDADVSELFHNRKLSHTCEVSSSLYSTSPANKVRFIFYYEEAAMLDKFIITGLTLLSGVSFSVYADGAVSPAVPTTPIIENYAQTPHTDINSMTENQVVPFAAVTAITYLLLLDGGESEVVEPPEGLINGDFSSGGYGWISGGAIDSNNYINYGGNSMEFVRNDSGTIASSQIVSFHYGILDTFTFSYGYYRAENISDSSIATMRIRHLKNGGLYQYVINSLLTNGSSTPEGQVSFDFTLTDFDELAGDQLEIVFSSITNYDVVFDDVSIKPSVVGDLYQNQPFDIRSLTAVKQGFTPDGWNFQRDAEFDSSIKYDQVETQSTIIRRKQNSNRSDSVEIIKESDASVRSFNNMVKYLLPDDGFVFWQRDADDYDFNQCMVCYLTNSGWTNTHEDINTIEASFTEVHEWL